MPGVEILRHTRKRQEESAKNGVVESVYAPVQILSIVRVVGMNAWRITDNLTEALKALERALAQTRLHGSRVPRQLEAPVAKAQHVGPVRWVLQRLRLVVGHAALGARERPHGLGRPHAELREQLIHGPYVLQRRDVGVVDNREGEPSPVWKARHGLRTIGRHHRRRGRATTPRSSAPDRSSLTDAR